MSVDPLSAESRVPTVRIAKSNSEILDQLGPLADLPGTWEGHGFNLVARPDFEGGANLFLELNLTTEVLKFDAIGSAIPNRGTVEDDLELFGLTYLQKISDRTTGGALHIEPGIWIFVQDPGRPGAPSSVARMGSIPHGNSILAEGTATQFAGPPTLSPGVNPTAGDNPAFSIFPSFNSTPFPAAVSPANPVFFAAGSSEFVAAAAFAHGFSQYTLTNPPSALNPRTPLGNVPAVLPVEITQELLNDPIIFLQSLIARQQSDGHVFEGTALNIATTASVDFGSTPNAPSTAPTISAAVAAGGGGIGNIPFLTANAESALVYATFWIERVSHPHRQPFSQLQYAQMVLLNFPGNLVPGKPNISWPHVSVATLRKTFG